MKWKSGMTKQEYYQSIKGKWLDHFLWLPKSIEGTTYWLETVECKKEFRTYMHCEWNGSYAGSPEYGKWGYLKPSEELYRVKES